MTIKEHLVQSIVMRALKRLECAQIRGDVTRLSVEKVLDNTLVETVSIGLGDGEYISVTVCRKKEPADDIPGACL